MTRLVLRDFTFSDGTYLPAGTFVSTPAQATHYDGKYYTDPEVFNPWRFAEMRGPDGKGMKYQLVTTSTEYMAFGHGRHAWCVILSAERGLLTKLGFVTP